TQPVLHALSFFLRERPPPRSTLFPYTTLFRSYSEYGRFEAWLFRILANQCRTMRARERRRGEWFTPYEPRHDAAAPEIPDDSGRSEEHTSELQSREKLVCRLLLEKKKKTTRAA